jgi:predicted nucleic acid-binding protein
MGPARSVIILDTNVLSELTRTSPSPEVLGWARAQDPNAIFTTAVCEAELLYGVQLLPVGKRRTALARAIEAMLGTVLGGRVLPFDRAAARLYAELAASHRSSGNPVAMADLQIAAIARTHRAAALATRNVGHFADCGVRVLDPWQAG